MFSCGSPISKPTMKPVAFLNPSHLFMSISQNESILTGDTTPSEAGRLPLISISKPRDSPLFIIDPLTTYRQFAQQSISQPSFATVIPNPSVTVRVILLPFPAGIFTCIPAAEIASTSFLCQLPSPPLNVHSSITSSSTVQTAHNSRSSPSK